MAVIGLAVAVTVATQSNWRMIALVFVGAAIGATLLLTSFGFSSAYRRAVAERDFMGFRAHALMFGLGSLLMVPAIQGGTLLGQPLTDFATPIGVSFVLGAIMFGCGMQLAGGCASGTLFLLGGGQARFLSTLALFIVGSTIGAAHMGFWRSLPALEPITVSSLGPWPLVLAIEIAVLALLFRVLARGRPTPPRLLVGAVLLAGLNFVTLALAGHPWSETLGFALWGSKIAGAFGLMPESWEFWSDNPALGGSVFADVASVMDIAIILGATAAAAATGRFRPAADRSLRRWLLAGVGGLLMGYGARLSDGCNIGAYFSAIVSGSFSGYVWAVAALAGSAVGVRTMNWLDHPGGG